MPQAKRSLRPGVASKKRKPKTTRELYHDHTCRDPKDETVIERIVRINQANRRKEVGLSQRALAKHLGVSQAYISAMESANKVAAPGLEMLDKLSAALSCRPSDLLIPGKFTLTEPADDE